MVNENHTISAIFYKDQHQTRVVPATQTLTNELVMCTKSCEAPQSVLWKVCFSSFLTLFKRWLGSARLIGRFGVGRYVSGSQGRSRLHKRWTWLDAFMISIAVTFLTAKVVVWPTALFLGLLVFCIWSAVDAMNNLFDVDLMSFWSGSGWVYQTTWKGRFTRDLRFYRSVACAGCSYMMPLVS